MGAPWKRHWYVNGGVPLTITLKTAVASWVTVRLMGGWMIDGKTDDPPQFVAMMPLLITVPMIVPQPLSVALLEIIRPLAKECVPPRSSSVAAFVPLPTINGDPFATLLFLVRNVPPAKSNCAPELVMRRLSVVTVPSLMLMTNSGAQLLFAGGTFRT